MTNLYEIDDSRMPLRLGSALRVPSYAYSKWGINGNEEYLRKLSEEAYRAEWADGSPRQMQYVSAAMQNSGYGDFPQILRKANARAVSRLVKKFPGKVVIADVGAGESTVTIFDRLEDEDKDRIHLTLIEPSVERIEAAAAKLEMRGFSDFDLVVGSDLGTLQQLPAIPQIISYVATLHHHAYLDEPAQALYRTLQTGGFLTVADWHNPMWEHPNRVYEFLQTLQWKTKEEDLEAFAEKFPLVKRKADHIGDPYQRKAMRLIQDFWRGWAAVRREAVERGEFDSRDEIFMLEGHRPFVSEQETMSNAGFSIAEEHRLLKDSELLMLGVYQKI
ncbi:MAG: hypothetical protein HY515_03410 [Candidatus Aenigmarchaeota archaeon]|nr:hypothetical protein [Candidatus Aenigmarchaeota archaeon]